MPEVREAEKPEFSEPVVHYVGATYRLEWRRRGYRGATLVADELVEQWVADKNEHAALRERLAAAEAALAEIAQPYCEHSTAGVGACYRYGRTELQVIADMCAAAVREQLPPPIKVGDRVEYRGVPFHTYEVRGIDGDHAWLLHTHNGNRYSGPVGALVRVEEGE